MRLNQSTEFKPLQTYPAFTLGTDYTVIAAKSCWVEYLAFCNTDSADRTVTVADGSNIEWAKAMTVKTAEPPYEAGPGEPGIYFDKGLKVKASVGSVVRCWVRFRYAA